MSSDVGLHSSIRYSTCPCIRCQTCEHDILKTNELILMPSWHKWTVEQGDEPINFGVKGQGHRRLRIDL